MQFAKFQICQYDYENQTKVVNDGIATGLIIGIYRMAGGYNAMIFSYIKNLFHRKKKCRKENKYNLDEILEFGIEYNRPNTRTTQNEYMEIYGNMKKEMGLNDIKIEYKLNQPGPAACMFKQVEEDNYELSITVFMTSDSQMQCYKASLAHELWHVKTSLELIQEIGIYEFVKLQKESDLQKSLAFKTISEYYSWYKATSEYNEKKCSIRLGSRLSDYKNKKINEIELCDTIAAHCAWNVFNNVVGEEENLSEEDKLFVKRIMQIIMENTKNWPLQLERLKNMGEDMLKAFMNI